MNLSRKQAIFLTVLIFLFLANLAFLDFTIFFHRQRSFPSQSTVTPTPTGSFEKNESCPTDCLEVINEATKAALAQISPYPALAPVVVSGDKTNEFFVSLGGGSTRAREWEDLSGLEAYIDSSKYGKIKETVFEAGVSIPNGNQKAYVRLFNVTDKHPVWFSEVWLEGGTPQLLVSEPITLDRGKKLYRVQMKTSLRHLAVLTQARVKITTQ